MDPPGCTDIDDALHCIELSNGKSPIKCQMKIHEFFAHHSKLWFTRATSRNFYVLFLTGCPTWIATKVNECCDNVF